MQPITDFDAFFSGAKQALADYSALNKKVAELNATAEKLEAQLEQEQKHMNDLIDSTMKKRREEVVSTYDSELEKGQERMRKVKAKREKAKNAGIKERISAETAELRSENKNLKSEIKTIVKNDHIPAYCNTELFYSLFYPKSFGDVLKIILAILIFFLVIPVGVYYLFFREQPVWVMIIIYFVDILIFGGLAILIKGTASKHNKAIQQILVLRKQIKTNDAKIQEITTSVKNDSSEDKYDLAAYDDEIAHIEQELADITIRKGEALNNYETVTKNIIRDEITENCMPKINELTESLAKVKEELAAAEEERKQKALELSNEYEVYLGREFMNAEKIDRLAEIISHGTATNISEAIEEYRRQTEI